MGKWLIVAIVCSLGAIFYPGNPPMEKHSAEYVAQHRDTLDGIAGKWYHRDQRDICWDEFRHENWKINAHLQNSRRCLQPGDLVRIEWYERKQDNGRKN